MPGTSRNRDEFRRKEPARNPVQRPEPLNRVDAGTAYEMGYEQGHAVRRAEDFFDGAQAAIDAAKQVSLPKRLRGGAAMEGAIKDRMRSEFEQRGRQLPPGAHS